MNCNARMTTVGTYVNLWTTECDYDVFITLNEANDPPTPDEVDEIDNKIRPIFESDEKEKLKVAKNVLDNLGLHCLMFGGEVVIKKGNNDTTKKTLQRIQTLLDKVSDGIEEYACTLESTDVIRDPLDKIYDIIEKELTKTGTE